MPSVIDHLHYRLVDVSSIKELAKRWYRAAFAESPDKHGGHRALADILESIQELEYYRRVLFPAEPVTTERAREVAREVVALGIPAMGEAPRPNFICDAKRRHPCSGCRRFAVSGSAGWAQRGVHRAVYAPLVIHRGTRRTRVIHRVRCGA